MYSTCFYEVSIAKEARVEETRRSAVLNAPKFPPIWIYQISLKNYELLVSTAVGNPGINSPASNDPSSFRYFHEDGLGGTVRRS